MNDQVMIKSHNKNVFENQYRDAINRRIVNAIFLTIQLIRTIIDIVTRSAFCECISFDKIIDLNNHVNIATRLTFYNHEWVIKSQTNCTTRKYLMIDNTINATFLTIQSIRKQFDIIARSTSKTHCKYNLFDKTIDSKTIMFASRFHVTNSVLFTV